MVPVSEPIPPRLVEEALACVLASRDFKSSERKRRFLQFVVRETMAGHADRIKAYAVAIDVFDRDASFDPSTDPVVRIEAGRLRRCLEHYYMTDGIGDPVRIKIPKGSYVPQFITSPVDEADPSKAPPVDTPPVGTVRIDGVAVPPPHAAALPAPAPPPSWWRARGVPQRRILAALLPMAALLILWLATLASPPPAGPSGDGLVMVAQGPTLMVLPLATDTGDGAQQALAESFTEELIGELLLLQNLLTFGPDTSFRYRTEEALRDAVPDVKPDYVLAGGIERAGGEVRVTIALLSTADRRTLWSDSFHKNFLPGAVTALQREIVTQVAVALTDTASGKRAGIGRRNGLTAGLNWPGSLATYECMLETRHYGRQRSAELHQRSRDCLERSIRTDPRYAAAWAALALVYIDEARFGFNRNPARPDPVGVGLRLARHAAELEPDNPFPHRALGLALGLRHETRASIDAYERARALAPHDSRILAALGRSYSFAGDWKRGIPLVQEAFLRNPAEPSRHRLILALFHYVHGRYDEALAEAGKVACSDEIYVHVTLAMIHGQTGRLDDAAREVKEILRLDPEFGKKAIPELQRRNLDPAIITQMAEGLSKAGLVLAPMGEGASSGL
ncbi:tetratricopeptide repeat protein [Azospirillum doebereinerae]